MARRRCIEDGCAQLTERTRCRSHEAEHEHGRGGTDQRGYGSAWQRLSSAAIAAEPWCHNLSCPYDDVGSVSNPLTGEHLDALGLGGPRRPDPTRISVLCRRCNSAGAAAIRMARKSV